MYTQEPLEKATDKIIIRCEAFEVQDPAVMELATPRLGGLCINCDNAIFCQLPGRKVGVWHCEEYT